jgi:ubiquinone/menaquinone biosynthesis C-methylase UbiE
MPRLQIAGIDVSPYALENAVPEVRPFLRLGDARDLPYPDKSFDLVTAINTVHNLEVDGCKQALREIRRVSRHHAFIVVDGWKTPQQEQQLREWVLTAKTYFHADDWVALFREVGYTGDYYWFTFE